MYNRLFILQTAVFMYAVHQQNVRAFYKKLSGIISNGRNDTMFWLGFASMISLPMVGIFDEHQWPLPHGTSAVIFFITFGIYSVMLANSLNEHRAQFPQAE